MPVTSATGGHEAPRIHPHFGSAAVAQPVRRGRCDCALISDDSCTSNSVRSEEQATAEATITRKMAAKKAPEFDHWRQRKRKLRVLLPVEDRERALSRMRPIKTIVAVACCCAVLLAVLGLGLIGFLWSKSVYRQEVVPPVQTNSDASDAVPPEPMAPIALPERDILSIKQAMTNCDEEAAQNPDGMYFLVIPVIPANFESATLLIPPGEAYGSFSLIPSQALLSGLENRSLNLSERQYEFSVLDTETAQIQKWLATKGPSKFTQPNAIALSKFQMGFDFGAESVGTNQFNRQKEICYWANVNPPCANGVCDLDPQLMLQKSE
jgi:hypothetical protein